MCCLETLRFHNVLDYDSNRHDLKKRGLFSSTAKTMFKK